MPDTPTPEEEYFFEQNQALIRKQREKLDRERMARERAERKTTHWMKCPKCGADMREIDHAGLKLDQCTECLGTYFDHGELDLLIRSVEPKGFLESLKGLLGG
jgi:hypothetical protein